MPLMKAVQIAHAGAGLVLIEKEIPEPKEREVLVKVEACGVCHGDAAARFGTLPGVTYPRVPGHEIVGTVAKAGPGATAWRPGTRVGVGWSGGWCGACEACGAGRHPDCQDAWTTGLSVDGGYAEYAVARASALIRIPDGLSSEAAAPLLCAGATTFSALQESGARAGDVVAVQGIGGLGHLGIQYANRMGFTTVAVSRGRDKEAMAYEFGAHHYIDAAAGDAAAALRELGGAKVVLCTAPDATAISDIIGGLAHGGQLIVVASPRDPIQLRPGRMFEGGLAIKGWHGQRADDAMAFSRRFKVLPLLETYPLERAAEAFDRMMAATVRFRAVLTMTS